MCQLYLLYQLCWFVQDLELSSSLMEDHTHTQSTERKNQSVDLRPPDHYQGVYSSPQQTASYHQVYCGFVDLPGYAWEAMVVLQ